MQKDDVYELQVCKAENKFIARSLNSMRYIPKKHNQLGESLFLTTFMRK